MLAAIYTLGCKVNQYETQAMEQELVRRGHTLVPFDQRADAYIVNTCSVTAVSDKKSRQMIRRCRKLNPDAVVAACGCYVQTHAEEAAGLDVDLIAGTGDRMAFLDLLEQVTREKQVTLLDDALKRRTFEVLPAGGMAERTRAMLKVEDGCVNFCTYCIIPYARGPVRSLPKAEAVSQTEQLRQEGYRELVLTGIEISSWGHDLKNGETLIDLLEAVSAAAGDMRLRLGSLEPRTITEDFCRRAAALSNLCPHFHLSLRSGCDATLRRMNRKYECGFAAMHIFPYSLRPGTPAAAMEQVPPAVKEARAARAAQAAERMHRAYLEGCVGRVYPVLFEQPRDGRYTGHAPNYMEVAAAGEGLHNIVKNVRITGVDGELLTGEVLP